MPREQKNVKTEVQKQEEKKRKEEAKKRKEEMKARRKAEKEAEKKAAKRAAKEAAKKAAAMETPKEKGGKADDPLASGKGPLDGAERGDGDNKIKCSQHVGDEENNDKGENMKTVGDRNEDGDKKDGGDKKEKVNMSESEKQSPSSMSVSNGGGGGQKIQASTDGGMGEGKGDDDGENLRAANGEKPKTSTVDDRNEDEDKSEKRDEGDKKEKVNMSEPEKQSPSSMSVSNGGGGGQKIQASTDGGMGEQPKRKLESKEDDSPPAKMARSASNGDIGMTSEEKRPKLFFGVSETSIGVGDNLYDIAIQQQAFIEQIADAYEGDNGEDFVGLFETVRGRLATWKANLASACRVGKVVECEIKVNPDHIISDIYRRLKRLEDRADAAEFGSKKTGSVK